MKFILLKTVEIKGSFNAKGLAEAQEKLDSLEIAKKLQRYRLN